jgi:hypothetical protein
VTSMSRHFLFVAPALVFAAAMACGDDPTTTTADGALTPVPMGRGPRGRSNPPRLTRRLDRAGRPEVAATLLGAFEADAEARQDAVRRYDAAGLGNRQFLATFEASLALIDGMDGVCGNQLWPDPASRPRYRALASLLLDDQIYVHAERLGGSVYLGLEAEAAGALEEPRGGAAGGRAPGHDVIQSTYSSFVAGTLSGVDDGVQSDDKVHDPSSFPFLADPEPE